MVPEFDRLLGSLEKIDVHPFGLKNRQHGALGPGVVGGARIGVVDVDLFQLDPLAFPRDNVNGGTFAPDVQLLISARAKVLDLLADGTASDPGGRGGRIPQL